MAKSCRPRITLRIAPGRQQYPIGCEQLAGFRSQDKTRSSVSLDRGAGDLRANRYAGVLSRVQQAGDNRFRLIRDGKDAAVAFDLEGHAAPLEPGQGITRLKACERAAQRSAAAWIVLH